jgi:hypothetical protein
MIPEEHKSSIITSGISFLRSITDAYGSDEGMKLWDAIANTLDPAVKGEIFFAMLRGEYQDYITLKGVGYIAAKITAIKEIRGASGLGLVEAKQAYEAAEQGIPVKIPCSPDKIGAAIASLRYAGMVI